MLGCVLVSVRIYVYTCPYVCLVFNFCKRRHEVPVLEQRLRQLEHVCLYASVFVCVYGGVLHVGANIVVVPVHNSNILHVFTYAAHSTHTSFFYAQTQARKHAQTHTYTQTHAYVHTHTHHCTAVTHIISQQ
jgi:hypothetical protein